MEAAEGRVAGVLITGAAGFLGYHLCDRFVRDGWDVVGVDSLLMGTAGNLARLLMGGRFRFLQQDVTMPFFVEESIDVVLHFASPASPKDYLHPGTR